MHMVDNNVIIDGIIVVEAFLYCHDVQMAIATTPLYYYRLNYGLICFDDEL